MLLFLLDASDGLQLPENGDEETSGVHVLGLDPHAPFEVPLLDLLFGGGEEAAVELVFDFDGDVFGGFVLVKADFLSELSELWRAEEGRGELV